jgi:hypothetical protein
MFIFVSPKLLRRYSKKAQPQKLKALHTCKMQLSPQTGRVVCKTCGVEQAKK